MASEAVERDNSFRDNLSLTGISMGVLNYEYLMRSKLWKEAMVGGLQWQGIPGLRGIALGESRNLSLGGGRFNKAGINLINKPVQSILSSFGFKGDIVKYGIGGKPYQNRINGRFAKGFSSNIFGKILGGTQTNLLKIDDALVNTKLLEKNWFRSLYSEKVRSSKFAVGSKLGTKSTAWKFAMSQKFMPGGIWAANLAFAASIAAPIFSAAGQLVNNSFQVLDDVSRKFNNRQLDFGGKIHQSYMGGAGQTERQRALQELQRSRTNARSFMGNEASMLHQ